MKTLFALFTRHAGRWLKRLILPLAVISVPTYGYLLTASSDIAPRPATFVPQPVVCGVRG